MAQVYDFRQSLANDCLGYDLPLVCLAMDVCYPNSDLTRSPFAGSQSDRPQMTNSSAENGTSGTITPPVDSTDKRKRLCESDFFRSLSDQVELIILNKDIMRFFFLINSNKYTWQTREWESNVLVGRRTICLGWPRKRIFTDHSWPILCKKLSKRHSAALLS